MKTLVVVLALVASACEHDPRYDRERRIDKRGEAPPPAALPTNDVAPKPERTVDRHPVVLPTPKVTPLQKRVRHHKH